MEQYKIQRRPSTIHTSEYKSTLYKNSVALKTVPQFEFKKETKLAELINTTDQLLFFVARVTVSGAVGRLDFCIVVIASDLGKSRVLGGGGGRMQNEPADCYA